MDVTLRQLEVFVAVARERHFRRAAASLHVTQPVVSQEIRRLERSLGAALFERSTRTVSLTSVGADLLAGAEQLHEGTQSWVRRARQLAEQHVRRVRVAVTPSVMDELLPAIMRCVEMRLVDAVVEEVAVQTGEVADALADGRCDVGIGRFVTPPPGHVSETIRAEQVMIALSSRHPLASGTSVDLAAMGDLPLLLWPRTQNPAYHDHLMAICADRGLEPLVLVSPPLIVGGRSYLIADGRAFGLIPESTASRITPPITVLPLSTPATVPLEVVWRGDDKRPVIGEFLEIVRSVAGS